MCWVSSTRQVGKYYELDKTTLAVSSFPVGFAFSVLPFVI